MTRQRRSTAAEKKVSPLEQAIYRSFAVIEFDVDGTIRRANSNFLRTMGYEQEEIAGHHHRIFVDDEFARSVSYAQFWTRLAEGQFFSDRVRRVGKGGETVWLQATYNPVLDDVGDVTHVVKFATDITAEVAAEERLREGVRVMLGMISDSSGLATDISSATDELAATAESQSSRAAEMSGASQRIRETISKSVDYSARVDEQAESAGERARNGARIVEATIERIRELSEAIRGAGETVEKLAESGAQIGAIIAVIEDIAENTHMLSLNAAIEAARAGERGDGFGVVAREIRKLSERTREATGKIVERVRLIQSDTDEVVGIMRASESSMGETTGQADRAGTALQDIVQGSRRTIEMIHEVARLLAEQQAESRSLADQVAIVSTSAEESADATRQIAMSAGSLSSLSVDLRREVLGLQPEETAGTAELAQIA